METLEESFKNRVLFTANSSQPLPKFFSEIFITRKITVWIF